jgi:hypothetical protein
VHLERKKGASGYAYSSRKCADFLLKANEARARACLSAKLFSTDPTVGVACEGVRGRTGIRLLTSAGRGVFNGGVGVCSSGAAVCSKDAGVCPSRRQRRCEGKNRIRLQTSAGRGSPLAERVSAAVVRRSAVR